MIRTARADDLNEMTELCALHAQHEGLTFCETGQVERWKVALFGSTPRLYAWVVEAPGGNALLGYMTAVTEFSTWTARDFVYMDCLYLRAHARGQGWGSKLIAVLQRFAGERGIDELQWQTPPSNKSAVGFYRRLGSIPLEKVRFTLEAHR